MLWVEWYENIVAKERLIELQESDCWDRFSSHRDQ